MSPRAADPAQRAVVRAIRAAGVDVTLLVPDRWQSGDGVTTELASWTEDAGVRVMPIGVRGAADDPDRLRWSAGTIRRHARDARPDIVHLECEPWTVAAGSGAIAARRIGAPYVIAAAQSVPTPGSLPERWRRARLLRAAGGIAGASRIALDLIAPLAGDVPQAVLPDIPTLLPPRSPAAPHEGFSIGFVGRLVPERGLDLLLQACVRLYGPWHLSVVGTGPSQEELEALAQRLGIAARVRWLGGLPQAALTEVWPTLDCVVLPARTTDQWVEASGVALRQAMAHGVAPIGSTSGALPEVIGDAGIVVPEQNVPALTEALQRLANEPDELTRLQQSARQRILNEFVPEAIARRTLALWTAVLARRAPAAAS